MPALPLAAQWIKDSSLRFQIGFTAVRYVVSVAPALTDTRPTTHLNVQLNRLAVEVAEDVRWERWLLTPGPSSRNLTEGPIAPGAMSRLHHWKSLRTIGASAKRDQR